MEPRFITPEEAIALLDPNADRIHTFRSGMILIGADWDKSDIIQTLKDNPDSIQIGGEQCRAMGHGLVVDSNGLLFIEVDKEVLDKFDPIEALA